MTSPPPIDGVLETVLYYGGGEEQAVERFYTDILGMRPIGRLAGRQLFFRAGSSVFLLFNRETTIEPGKLPPHGASGIVHTCLVVPESAYEPWKDHLRRNGVEVQNETEWKHGVSFYFHDPAGNLLEIANRDFWPS